MTLENIYMYIQWTLDPARSCLVPGSIVTKKTGSYECFIYNTEAVFEIIVAIIINSNISWQVALINTYA